MTRSHRFLPVGMQACLVLAALAVASCTSPSSSSSSSHSLQQVEASNPSVTYEYVGDAELIRNSSRRGGMPRRIAPAADGNRQCQTSTPTRTVPRPWYSTAPEVSFNSRRLRPAGATRACAQPRPPVRFS
jgi:hypothetical protein